VFDLQMDGYVATFDSSIIGEDANSLNLHANGPTSGAGNLSPPIARNSGSVTGRPSLSQLQSTPRFNATVSSARIVPSNSSSYLSPEASTTLNQRLQNGKLKDDFSLGQHWDSDRDSLQAT
jgi:hypothetical protein